MLGTERSSGAVPGQLQQVGVVSVSLWIDWHQFPWACPHWLRVPRGLTLTQSVSLLSTRPQERILAFFFLFFETGSLCSHG